MVAAFEAQFVEVLVMEGVRTVNEITVGAIIARLVASDEEVSGSPTTARRTSSRTGASCGTAGLPGSLAALPLAVVLEDFDGDGNVGVIAGVREDTGAADASGGSFVYWIPQVGASRDANATALPRPGFAKALERGPRARADRPR